MKNRRRDISFEKKPVFKEGETVTILKSELVGTVHDVEDDRDLSDQFRSDCRDGLLYRVFVDGALEEYRWWDMQKSVIPTDKDKRRCREGELWME